jgi:hypothetical protein
VEFVGECLRNREIAAAKTQPPGRTPRAASRIAVGPATG